MDAAISRQGELHVLDNKLLFNVLTSGSQDWDISSRLCCDLSILNNNLYYVHASLYNIILFNMYMYMHPRQMEPIRSPSPSQRLSLSAQLKHRLSMGSRQSLISSIGPSASEVGGVRPTSPVPSGFRPTSAPLTCSTRSLGQSTAISMETGLSRPVTAERPKPM